MIDITDKQIVLKRAYLMLDKRAGFDKVYVLIDYEAIGNRLGGSLLIEVDDEKILHC